MAKAPANIHDQTFSALMANRNFVLGFYQSYLPAAILRRIDFNTLAVLNLAAKTVDEKTLKSSQVDIAHTVKLDGKDAILWIHCEHQTRAERFMPIRITHYQCGKLLEYAKLNRCKTLPPILTILYHQGKKPYAYSVNLNELFSDPLLAERYFTKPILIDLPALDDQSIVSHPCIGPAEMVLKYIRSSQFPHKYRALIQQMTLLDDKTRHVLIYYLIERADIPEDLLIEAIMDHLPQDEDIVMTVAQQIEQRGIKQGIEQGIQQGVKQGIKQGIQQGVEQGRSAAMRQMAKKQLAHGFAPQTIRQWTGLSLEEIKQLAEDA